MHTTRAKTEFLQRCEPGFQSHGICQFPPTCQPRTVSRRRGSCEAGSAGGTIIRVALHRNPPKLPDFKVKPPVMSTTTYNRYILNETNSARAIEQGLAEADWYTCPVPKAEMRKLLERRDGPAMRDTLLWFALFGWVRLCRLCAVGQLVGGVPVPGLRRALRLHLGLALARIEPRHRLQDRLDEQRALRDRLVHGDARIDASGAGATPATTATPSSSAATRRSPCRARRTCKAMLLELLQPRRPSRRYFRNVLLHCRRPADRGGEDLHPRIRVWQGVPARRASTC